MKLKMFASLFGLTAIFSIASPALAADAFKAGQYEFSTPKGWKKLESTSSMRAAELKAGEAKDAPDVVFYYFGAGGAGGTQANVDRWLGQFQEPRDGKNTKTESKTVGKTKVTYVQAEGTYMSGMPGGPKTPQAGTMLYGAIIAASEGSVFVRMTGPVEQAKKAIGELQKMVEAPLK